MQKVIETGRIILLSGAILVALSLEGGAFATGAGLTEPSALFCLDAMR